MSLRQKPTIVCLTPVKNEAWILDRFLQCASLWADHIIVSDQDSDDGSRDIAARYPKVILVDNYEPLEYDEYQMRKRLFDEAEKIPEPKILIALDADEVFTPNVLSSPSWSSALDAPPGTSLRFQLANLRPDLAHYWTQPVPAVIGFVDDGSEFACGKIHTSRIHHYEGMPVFLVDQVAVMHYQYADWERMKSKHRWYKCWERVNRSRRSATGIYRQYHHMETIGRKDLQQIPAWWFDDYVAKGIDMTTVIHDGSYRWDIKVLEYLASHGAGFFSDIDIWDVSWEEMARMYDYDNPILFRDPRSRTERVLHSWLKATQPYASNYILRALDIMLGTVF
jgi:hypothetical protein